MKLFSLFAILANFVIVIPMNAATERITVGGGCFWCTEAVYEALPGVKSVVAGYEGGKIANPTYEQVSGGQSGHAEVIQIEFDPAITNVDKILDLFFVAHDPTTLNRQGADSGTQYRSVVYYVNEAQKKAAEAAKTRAQAELSKPIVTEIAPSTTFYAAENYHQDYFKNNPNAGYCTFVIRPKIEKLEKQGLIEKSK